MSLIKVFAILSIICYAKSTALSAGAETYHVVDDSEGGTVEQDVTVNLASNTAVLSAPSLDGSNPEGLVTVIDYGKSVSAAYDADSKRCYIHGGVPRTIPTAGHLKQALDEGKSGSGLLGPTKWYRLGDDYPVRDRTLLPVQLRRRCANLPLRWVEPLVEANPEALEERSFEPNEGLQVTPVCLWNCPIYNCNGRSCQNAG
jgi:hypothetical protein